MTHPRATSGDVEVEPNWQNRLTITVGSKGADITGTDQRAIQAAVDYVARLGGGTVRIQPGEYVFHDAIHLASRVRLEGSGAESILLKAPSVTTKLAQDSDWYDQEITLADPAGFEVGYGICLRTKNPHHGGLDVAKRTLVARDGSRFKLDRALRQNFWLAGDTEVSTLFALLDGDTVEHVSISSLALDGNKAQNENLDGNYAGCVFLQDCRRISIQDVTARNYNGDGISWQICHDVVVERCHSQDHAGLGLHPGSGSQRPIIRGNTLERNDIGLFFCWGVKYGLAEDNLIVDNRKYGVSIGHRDNENLICKNRILRSGETGVLFRAERGADFAPHRNRLVANQIVDSGNESGIGVDVTGETQAVVIEGNEIRETRAAASRVGVRLGPQTRDIRVAANQITGFAIDVQDMHA